MKIFTEQLKLVESKNNKPKPIHLFKNDNTFVSDEAFDCFVKDLEKEWPAALMDNHEDEYLYITSEYADFNQYENLLDKDKIKDGFSTRGIGENFYGYHKYDKLNKYPVYKVFRGNWDRKTTNSLIIADKTFFES